MFYNMIQPINDDLLTSIAVRIKNSHTNHVIGSGVLYYEDKLGDKAYIFTAAHCLFADPENYIDRIDDIKIDLYNSSIRLYESIRVQHDRMLIDTKNDISVIIVDKTEVEKIVGEIPVINISYNRQNYTGFVIKGFPRATQGIELDVIYPSWKQVLKKEDYFQLELRESYTDWSVQGFSGSGVFVNTTNEIYLHGIFSRFRSEEKGKVIYCKNLSNVNALLVSSFLPKISNSYLGNNNLTATFFKNHIEKSIKNLGPRFNEELNFRLPIAKLFNDLSFDDKFKSRFYKVFDNWLLESIYHSFPQDSSAKYIDEIFLALKNKVKEWATNNVLEIGSPLKIEWITDAIHSLNSKINEEESKFWDLQFEERKKKKEKDKESTSYDFDRQPYESELRRLAKMERVNNELLSAITNKVNISIANNPVLIIDGEAGSGKSHLLGDIAIERLKNNIPTILLLGQHFTLNQNIENNILQLLNLDCSFEEFLDDLNQIGKQIGSRVLILIDAINEGAGGKLWKNQILGLFTQISKRPYLGIVLTIRTTYLKSIISEEIKNDANINYVTHQGFKGNEYQALRMFCEFHDLEQPSFPILSPEFTSPLFLKIICEGIRNNHQKKFPQGFQGARKLFDSFIQAVDKKLEEKREEYLNRKVTIKVIEELAKNIYKSKYNRLSLDDAFKIMDEKFSQFNNLLSDLIEEGVFIKNPYTDYKSGEDIEYIYFAYERLGDYYVATELIKQFKSKEEVKKAFEKNTELGKLLLDEYYSKDGILEALSTLLPEQFGLEIFEVYDWLFVEMSIIKKEKGKEKYRDSDYMLLSNTASWLCRFFMDSLNWRTISSIDDEKITDWLKSDSCKINNDEWFLKLVELSAIKNHPLNANRLHKILSRFSMPERDSFWQQHLRFYGGYDDHENGFPIRRLIDWSWSKGISFLIDENTANLCGHCLAWVLATTNRNLRDQTTKALVNLLVEQPKALLGILKAFENINDMYVAERLYAVANGCVLRTKKNESILLIAKFVYDKIFKNSNPPKHILLRDYARNIVEFAHFKKLKFDYDLNLVRPPYNTTIPELPSEEEISKYNIDYKSEEFDKEYGHVYNNVHFSVMEWDFGTKTIDPEINHFYPIAFQVKCRCKDFMPKLKGEQKKLIKLLKSSFEKEESLKRKRAYFRNKEEEYDKLIKLTNELQNGLIKHIGKIFKGDDLDFVKSILVQYLRDKARIKEGGYGVNLDSTPFKRWIVDKVFALGYNMEQHGNYDKNFSDYSGRYSENIETIGAKYRWIAFHEILALIADNYKIKSWRGSQEKFDFYQGTWQLYARDIDPISITKNENEFEDVDDFGESEKKSWWSMPEHDYWDVPNIEWSSSLDGLPNPKDVIIKQDNSGNEWVYLEYYPDWKEPKKLGEDKYFSDRKRIHYMIQAYLVRKKDRTKIVDYLKDKSFLGEWMPNNTNKYSNLYNREKFWSPAYFDMDQEPIWKEIIDKETQTSTGLEVVIATTDAKGRFNDDKSGANIDYNIPCSTLFEGLGLFYSDIDGDFVDSDGVKIVTNVSKGTMIRKVELQNFLRKNRLSIIWKLFGEKIAKSNNSYYHIGVPCGVFYLEKGSFHGNLKMHERGH